MVPNAGPQQLVCRVAGDRLLRSIHEHDSAGSVDFVNAKRRDLKNGGCRLIFLQGRFQRGNPSPHFRQFFAQFLFALVSIEHGKPPYFRNAG